VTGGVMYQIQPRAFTREGTLKAAEARMPRLAGLGVSIIYLCPVFVAAAHRLKLRVMLDMVYLHCGPKAVFIKADAVGGRKGRCAERVRA